MNTRSIVRMVRLACLILAVLAMAPCCAQAPTYEWHTFFNPGETRGNDGSGKAVATDLHGNIYIAGVTQTPTGFAPGFPIHGVEADPSGVVGFVMKLNCFGSLQWYSFYHVKSFTAIAVEADGASLYLTGGGSFRDDGLPPPLYNGAPSDLDTPTFLLKLDAQGVYQWHTEYNRSNSGADLAIDPTTHNIYITGEARADWGGWPQAALHEPDFHTSAAPFILALTQNGSYLWHSFYGIGFARSVAVDGSGNIFMTGQWDTSVFVAKVGGPNSTAGFGNLEWTRQFGGRHVGFAVTADATGNVYATGNASWAGPHPSPPLHIDGTNTHTFVVKFDANGVCLWYTLYGGGDLGSWGEGIVLDGLGRVYIAGTKDNYAFLGDGGVPSLHDNSQPSGRDGGHFVLALNTSGAYQWHTFYGRSERYGNLAHGIALDSNRNIFVVGGSAYPWLGDNNTLPLLPHAGVDSVFLMKLGQASPAPTTTVASNVPVTYSPAMQSIPLTATVTSAAGPVNEGQMNFMLFGLPGTTQHVPVVNGVAAAIASVPGGTPVGNHEIAAAYQGTSNFAPSGDVKYIIVSKATPVISWLNPTAIAFGSALGSMQLNATANVPGTFVYSPPAGTVLAVGNTQTLSAMFTPADSVNYNSAAKSVLINVLPASPPATPAKLVITRSLSRNGSNQVVVILNISNAGGSAAQNIQLKVGKIGATTGTPLPQLLGSAAAGATVTATLTFPGSVGAAGAASTLTVSGTYTGGSFNSASRITLP